MLFIKKIIFNFYENKHRKAFKIFNNEVTLRKIAIAKYNAYITMTALNEKISNDAIPKEEISIESFLIRPWRMRIEKNKQRKNTLTHMIHMSELEWGLRKAEAVLGEINKSMLNGNLSKHEHLTKIRNQRS